jgi:SAM-dependent methyltransferase
MMTINVDPENNEPRALFDLADFNGRRVLEIGCGDGRLTWRYADKATHVTAIDPFEGSITRAKENMPNDLVSRVEFRHIAFEDFAAASARIHRWLRSNPKWLRGHWRHPGSTQETNSRFSRLHEPGYIPGWD